MSQVVRVAPGYSNVPLYSGVLNQGQQVWLTDDQYVNLPFFIQNQLQVVRATPDQYFPDQNDQNYTLNLISSVLRQMGVPLVLTWDGTQYQPSQYTADMTRVKFFVGPTDPTTVPGALLADNDQWISETS